MSTLDEVSKWVERNSSIAYWAAGRCIAFENGKIYLSAIKFYNEEECIFYSLKFGLK